MPIVNKPAEPVLDGTLASWLTHLSPIHQKIVAQFELLHAGDPIKAAWRTYVTGTRAWIYERESGDGGFAGGMSVMLCIPQQPAGNAEVPVAHIAWLDSVDVFGVPLLADGVKALTIHYLNSAKRPPGSARLSQRPQLLMSLPALLSAWTTYPPKGYSHGWRSLEALPDSQAETLWKWIAQLSSPRLTRLKTALGPFVSQTNPLTSPALENFFSALSELEELLAQTMVQRFVKHLNPVVVAGCLAKQMAVYPEDYNWVVGAKSARAWEWRMDALKVFPAISVSAVFPCLASITPINVQTSRKLLKPSRYAETAPVGGTVTFAEVVDQGLPLIKSLAQSFAVRPVAVRTLKGVTNRAVEMLGQPPLGWEDILRTLDGIPAERHPRTVEQWSSFSVLYLECVRLYQAMELLHATLARKFIEVTARPWITACAKDWLQSEARWRDGMHGLADLTDAIEVAHEVRDIVAGLGINASERYKAYAIFANLNPGAWRSFIHRLAPTEELNTTRWHEVWSCAFIDGVQVRALNSGISLYEEGKSMHHCIYSYRNRLRTKRQLAFTIGEDVTRDRSTVLLSYEQGPFSKWKVTVLEHHARFNHDPSSLCQTIADHLCVELSSDRHVDALTQANFERVRRCAGMPSPKVRTRGVIRAIDNRHPTNEVRDRSNVREPLLMLIAGV